MAENIQKKIQAEVEKFKAVQKGKLCVRTITFNSMNL